ncbi:MAG: ORF6N domain-containing protein [Bacteroidota bacterium]|nr:ORF6N domain-containing protein [Bacteroidota bacterium]
MNLIKQQEIENRILTIRGTQVMLDSHLAEMYGLETKILNRAVKRNLDRFPKEFMFQLTDTEWDNLRFQIGTLNNDESLRTQNVTLNNLRFQIGTSSSKHGGRRYLPFVFTEQGVAMLSAVLRSETAVKVSLQIMNAFVEMRKLILGNSALFQRVEKVEHKQLEADQKFEQIFRALESKEKIPDKGLFFDGQLFDAWQFVSDLIRKARTSIVLIDNFVDDTVLSLFTKRNKGVTVTIYTKIISKQLAVDIEKHNSQYDPLTIKELTQAHDRFLIIDETELYHIGASLKDLGKKWFAFSKMDAETINVLNKLNEKTTIR